MQVPRSYLQWWKATLRHDISQIKLFDLRGVFDGNSTSACICYEMPEIDILKTPTDSDIYQHSGWNSILESFTSKQWACFDQLNPIKFHLLTLFVSIDPISRELDAIVVKNKSEPENHSEQSRAGAKLITNTSNKERTPVELANNSSSDSVSDLNTDQVVEAYQRAKLRLAELNIDSLLPRSNLMELYS